MTLAQATDLFAETAQRVKQDFDVETEKNAVSRICQLVENLPLAVELAASWARVMPCAEIAHEIARSIDILSTTLRNVPDKHRTMRAAFEHSWKLLSADEQAVFRKLSVFRGGFTREAAEPVAAATLLTLGALVDKSLLRVAANGRYDVHELLRQYTHEKLLEAGEGEKVRDQHLDYFLQWAEHAQPELDGPEQVRWLNWLDHELDNWQAALGWALETQVEAGLRLASALWLFWNQRGYLAEGKAWLSRLLMQPGALRRTAVRAKALGAYSELVVWNDFEQGRRLAEESLALCRELGDRRGEASSLYVLGVAAIHLRDSAVGRALLVDSLALFRALGDKPRIADILHELGAQVDNQDYERTRTYLEESLALYRAVGHPAGIGIVLKDLGMQALWQGDYAVARARLEEGLALWRTVGARGWGTIDCLAGLGQLAFHEGDYERARAYFEESWSLSQDTGHNVGNPWVFAQLGKVALRQGDAVRARAMFEECQSLFYRADNKIGIAFTLEGMASLVVVQNQPDRALRLIAWADTARAAMGNPRPPLEQADVDRDLTAIHSQLDEATFAAAYAEGRTMTTDQVMAYASDRSEPVVDLSRDSEPMQPLG